MLRLLSELFWTLRREGFVLSPAQTITAVRAVDLVGVDDPTLLRDALAAVLVTRADERKAFEDAFDQFFSTRAPHPGDLFARLAARGFLPEELDLVRELLEAARHRVDGEATLSLGALRGSPHELDHMLFAARMRNALDDLTHPDQAGFFDHLVQRRLGVASATSVVLATKRALGDAFGAERGALLGAWLDDEWSKVKRRIRGHVDRLARMRAATIAPSNEPSTRMPGLDDAERRALARGLRRLAEKLRGSQAVRRHRAKVGSPDARATLRRALRTGGVPFETVYKSRRRDKPRLVVVCDVSESVRPYASFMLSFVQEVQELFQSTRTFVFVSDLRETTELFRTTAADRAIATIASGRVLPTSSNSNYGRAFAALEERTQRTLDKRTTLVILGDGRTNHLPSGEDALRRLSRKARAVLWLSPEPRALWGRGDSAMRVYAGLATRALEVRDPRGLMEAATALVRLR